MAFYPGPRPGRALHPDRSLLSLVEGEADRLRTLGSSSSPAHINAGMPHYVVDKVSEALNERRKSVNGSHVLVAGVAYKRDNRRHARVAGDGRDGPAARARRERCPTADPFVPVFHGREWSGGYDITAVDMTPRQHRAVRLRGHRHRSQGLRLQDAARRRDLIVDTRNAIKEPSRRCSSSARRARPGRARGKGRPRSPDLEAGKRHASWKCLSRRLRCSGSRPWLSVTSTSGTPACWRCGPGWRTGGPRPGTFGHGQWPLDLDHHSGQERSAPPADRVTNLLNQGISGSSRDHHRLGWVDRCSSLGLSGFGASVRVIEVPAGGKPLALNAGRGRVDGRGPGLRRRAAALRGRRPHGAGLEPVLNPPLAAPRRAAARLRARQRRDECRRRHRPLLEVREVDAPQREPRVVHARRDRRRLRAPPRLLDAAPRRHAARRRAGAMRAVLNGCRIVFEERAIAYRPRIGGCHRRNRAARPARWPATTRILAQEPRLLCLPEPGVAAVRVAQDRPPGGAPWALVALFASTLALASGNSLFVVPPLQPRARSTGWRWPARCSSRGSASVASRSRS